METNMSARPPSWAPMLKGMKKLPTLTNCDRASMIHKSVKLTSCPSLAKKNILHQLNSLDSLMSGYYRRYPGRFVKSIGYALIGWMGGLGELYFTLYFLGHEVSFTDLWIIEALSQLVRVGSFFIPLSIGAQEGGLALIFVSMA